LASTTFVDYYVGQVLEALEKSPYKDNTIVILWSDHGYRLGEKGTFAKHCLWQVGTHVPLIIKTLSPKSGSIVNQPVELLDIYPTLVELCGLEKNSRNEGMSLKPLLDNSESSFKKVATSTYGRNNHALVSEKYRYIRYENGAEELYDHHQDPNEWVNLAGIKKMQKVKKEFQKYLPKNNAPWSPKVVMGHNAYFANATVISE
jgi:arylsulfatase A-like enzyme